MQPLQAPRERRGLPSDAGGGVLEASLSKSGALTAEGHKCMQRRPLQPSGRISCQGCSQVCRQAQGSRYQKGSSWIQVPVLQPARGVTLHEFI